MGACCCCGVKCGSFFVTLWCALTAAMYLMIFLCELLAFCYIETILEDRFTDKVLKYLSVLFAGLSLMVMPCLCCGACCSSGKNCNRDPPILVFIVTYLFQIFFRATILVFLAKDAYALMRRNNKLPAFDIHSRHWQLLLFNSVWLVFLLIDLWCLISVCAWRGKIAGYRRATHTHSSSSNNGTRMGGGGGNGYSYTPAVASSSSMGGGGGGGRDLPPRYEPVYTNMGGTANGPPQTIVSIGGGGPGIIGSANTITRTSAIVATVQSEHLQHAYGTGTLPAGGISGQQNLPLYYGRAANANNNNNNSINYRNNNNNNMLRR